MVQICFGLKIKPEFIEEYKKAHNNMWPEYKKALRDSGFYNNSIFYQGDGKIIIYIETKNPEDSFSELASNPINTKWQEEMDHFIIKKNKPKHDRKTEEKNPLLKVRSGLEIYEQIFYLS